MNDLAERGLAESYPIRRAAQLTLYYWTRTSETTSALGESAGQIQAYPKSQVRYSVLSDPPPPGLSIVE